MAYLASYIKVRNEEVVVFLRACLAHVFLNLLSPLLSQSGCSFGHRKQAKIILSDQENVKSVQPHRKRNIAEDPLQHPWVGEVRGRKYPVLCPDNLRQGLYLCIVGQGRHNLCSSA